MSKRERNGNDETWRRDQKDRIQMIDLDKGSENRPRRPQRENPDPRRKVTSKNSGNHSDTSKKGKRRKGNRNREFLVITYVFLAMFLILIVYLGYFQMFKSDNVINSSYNSRLDLYAQRVIRGDIISGDGEILATTEVDAEGNETREYPYGRMFAHVVGYFNNGKGGLEAKANFSLLRSHSFFITQIYNDLTNQKSKGDSVVTTLDYDVQEAAYDALGDRKGAVVVMEAKTGKVLAMVSKPDYNPNELADNWDEIVNDESSTVLLNRAISGLYPPGSTFKIFTALEYIHEEGNTDGYSYECEGSIENDGHEIHCYHNSVHGQENLEDSFANSCNTSFATIGLSLDINKFQSLLNDMMFNKSLPGTVGGNASKFDLEASDGAAKIMQTAIGQGDTLVTPLHMAMVAAAIDNQGNAPVPYLMDYIQNDKETVIKRFHNQESVSLMSGSDASKLQQLMDQVVLRGTATALDGQSYHAAGKTGSAEYDSNGNSHGWFVGYGSKEGYEDIAIAVIVENGDSGSKSAVPVTKEVFDVYFNQ